MKHEGIETVNTRFMTALDDLVIGELVESKQDFCRRHSVPLSMLSDFENDPFYPIPQDLLSTMILEYGVCAHWLLTGVGPMYTFLVNVCKMSFGVPRRYMCMN